MQVSPVSDFKNRNRKKLFQLPSGLVVELIKIDPVAMMIDLGYIPKELLKNLKDIDKGKIEEIRVTMEKAISNEQTKQIEVLNYLVIKGVNKPKVTSRPMSEVAVDEVHISDFGDDLDALIDEIVEFSGLKQIAVSQ